MPNAISKKVFWLFLVQQGSQVANGPVLNNGFKERKGNNK